MKELKLVYCEKCGYLHTRTWVDPNDEKSITLRNKILTCPYCKGNMHYLEDDSIVSIKDYNLKDNQAFLRMHGFSSYYVGAQEYVETLEKKLIDEFISKLPTFDKYAMYERLDKQQKKINDRLQANEAAAQRMKDDAIHRERERRAQQAAAEAAKPKCPTCGSTNVKLISGGERAASIIGFGIFSKKIGKSYKCLNCKYTW